MGRNFGKNKIRNLSSKYRYSQKLIHYAKLSATGALKTASKIPIQKTAEKTGDLIRKKIADRITKVSKTSSQNNSETNKEEILRERYLSLEQRQKKLIL